MKALILAAGESKRLRPLTNDKQKCMLVIGGRHIIDYQIDALKRNRINEIVVVTGYQAEKLETYLTETYPELSFEFIRNPDYETTRPAHGLWLARKHLTETILYLNADVLYGSNIIKRVVKSRHPSITAVQRVPWDEEQVNVIVNADKRILEIGKHVSKELSYGEFIGVTKCGPLFNEKLVSALSYLTEEKFFDKFAVDAINLAIQRSGDMHIIDVSDLKTLEIDTVEDFKKAERHWRRFTLIRQNHPVFSAVTIIEKIKYLYLYIRKNRS